MNQQASMNNQVSQISPAFNKIKSLNIPPQLASTTDVEAEIEALNSFECLVNFDSNMTLRDIEKNVILETLKRQKHNRTKTARVLEIGIRTLQRKLKQYEELIFEDEIKQRSSSY
jgi:transcriptional regulator with PAS, ATPase and Fis domain